MTVILPLAGPPVVAKVLGDPVSVSVSCYVATIIVVLDGRDIFVVVVDNDDVVVAVVGTVVVAVVFVVVVVVVAVVVTIVVGSK